MESDRNNAAGDANATTSKPDFPARWGRPLVILGTGLFAVSLALPVIAGITPAELLPGWLGYLDVVLAFMFLITAAVIDTLSKGRIDNRVIRLSYRIYRIAASLPLLLLVVFFVFGEQIRWNVLLPGLAWRAWLVLYVLPAVLAVWKQE